MAVRSSFQRDHRCDWGSVRHMQVRVRVSRSALSILIGITTYSSGGVVDNMSACRREYSAGDLRLNADDLERAETSRPRLRVLNVLDQI